MADLLVLPKPAKACELVQASAKKLEHTALAEKKEWSQCYRENCWQVRQNRLCQTEKEQSRLTTASDRKVGESQGEREPHHGKGDWETKSPLIK